MNIPAKDSSIHLMTNAESASPAKIYDTTIIGAGPTGLFGLFYSCLRQMDTLLIDSLPELGGQLAALYPEKDIYDMPGYPRVKAKDLVDNLVEQASMHKAQDIVLGERVEQLENLEDGTIRLTTDKATTYITKTVIITTGAGAFKPNKIPLATLHPFEGQFLHYFVKDKQVFKGKKIVIVGGGDSAMDWVMNLAELADSIHLVHRRDVFRAHEDSVEKVMGMTQVPKHLFCELREFSQKPDGSLESVTIENTKTGERQIIEADHVIALLGFVADVGPIKNWNLELKGNSIVVNSRMETGRPGVYAAGDITHFDGKLKLIATGVGEAAIAVNAAKSVVDPTARMQPAHSTSLFEKKKDKAAATA
jgi:thioredoxin reductase (NADPH)